jgi:hypothetical protein
MASVDDVRDILNNIGMKVVSDTTIQSHITTCDAYIAQRKIDNATDTLIDIATKYWAAYLSIVSYSSTISRELGRVPPAVQIALDEQQRLAMGFLRSVLSDDDDIFGDGDSKAQKEPTKTSWAILTRKYDVIERHPSSQVDEI